MFVPQSHQHSDTTRLTHNTVLLLIGNVGGTGLAFLLSILIGRVLGEAGLGVYSAVLAWVFALSMLVDAGISTILTRDIAREPALTAGYLASAVRQRVVIGGSIMLLVLVAAPLLSDNPAVQTGLRLSALLLLIEPLFGLFTAIFRAHRQMLPIAALNIGMLIPQLALTAVAFALGAGIKAALLINVVTSAGRLLVGWVIYRRYYQTAPLTPDPSRKQAGRGEDNAGNIIPLMRLAFPFAIAAVLAVLQQRIGILLLERLADIGAVGQYAAASRFIEAARMLPNAFFGALFPTLAGLALHPEEFKRLFSRVWLGLAAFAVGCGFLGTVLALPVLRLTFGDSFVAAVPVLQIGVWTLLPGLLRSARILYWYAQGREGYVNRVTAVMLMLQVILGVLVVPQYGAVGLVATMVLVEWVGLALLR